jgi:hypothetical protein
MKFSIFPKYDPKQTQKLCDFLSELNEDLTGPPLPIAMTIWRDEKPIVLCQGYWEYHTGISDTVYLARSSSQVSSAMRAAVILCIIGVLEAFGDKETLSLYERPINRVRKYCYLNLTVRDLPYYLTFPTPAPVVAVGVEGGNVYFRSKQGQWLTVDGEIAAVEPSWVIEITE